MNASFNHTKPHNSKDLVVVDVIFGRPSCTDKWGWDCYIDREYSAHLKNCMSRKEFEDFANEADKALAASKLRSGGFLGNALIILTCCIGLACLKASVDSATNRAVDQLMIVTKKWNSFFADKDRPVTMRVKHFRKDFSPRHELRANGTIGATLDNTKRLSEIDDEAWIEIEIAS